MTFVWTTAAVAGIILAAQIILHLSRRPSKESRRQHETAMLDILKLRRIKADQFDEVERAGGSMREAFMRQLLDYLCSPDRVEKQPTGDEISRQLRWSMGKTESVVDELHQLGFITCEYADATKKYLPQGVDNASIRVAELQSVSATKQGADWWRAKSSGGTQIHNSMNISGNYINGSNNFGHGNDNSNSGKVQTGGQSGNSINDTVPDEELVNVTRRIIEILRADSKIDPDEERAITKVEQICREEPLNRAALRQALSSLRSLSENLTASLLWSGLAKFFS